jgi:DNA-binding response OmpR family regulator
MKVVVVDDDKDIVDLLKYNLEQDGIKTLCFTKPEEAWEAVLQELPDAIVTDWMMPEIDGIDFAKKVKFNPKTQHIPLMMISAKTEEGNVVTSLEFGFDDYMAKPFRLKEFVARVKRMIKRKNELNQKSHGDNEDQRELIVHDKLVIDSNAYSAYIEEEKIDLTVTEFKLLELLANKPGRVFTRAEIIEKINGMDYYATERSVDVQLVNLRRKLRDYKEYIVTIRSVGYCFKKG